MSWRVAVLSDDVAEQREYGMYWMCKYELPTLRFSKVIVRQTHRYAESTEIINHAASHVVSNKLCPREA